MKHSSKPPAPVGRTRWRRFAAAAAAGFGAVGVLGYLAMTGVLALSFAFSGIPFTLSANTLQGSGFVQYAFPDEIASNSEAQLEPAASQLVGVPNINNVVGVGGKFYASDTVTQLRSATITGLQQSICAPTPLGVSLRVNILGSGNTTASNLTIQAPALTASSAQFSNIIIGQSVKDALTDQGFGAGNDFTDPYGALSGAPIGNSFGQGADTVRLEDIRQIGIGTEAGTFNIGGLRLYAQFVNSCA